MPNHTSQSPIFSSPFFARFWRIAGAVSVRTKILGIVLALVLLLGVGITVQVRVVMQRALESWMEEQSVSVARDLAARATDFILVNDLFALHQLLDETQRNHPNVRYAIGYKLSHFVSCQARNWLQFTHDKSNQKIQKHSPAYTGHSGR